MLAKSDGVIKSFIQKLIQLKYLLILIIIKIIYIDSIKIFINSVFYKK